MNPLQILSASEQVAKHLRCELVEGKWLNIMPGADRLVTKLGVGRDTIKAALQQLENEGLLISQGARRPRRIILPAGKLKSRKLRVRILAYDKEDLITNIDCDLMGKLHHAGFSAEYGKKTQKDLGMNVDRVARFVSATPADAWIINSGSHEILDWFSKQTVPVIARFGRFSGLPIASACPRNSPALITAIRRLVALGHSRIVMLASEERLKPYPAVYEQTFLTELEAQGLAVSSYNLPAWEDSQEGFRACLDSLFQHTPPTALILTEMKQFAATQQYLAHRDIRCPEDISLINGAPDLSLAWCSPSIAHIRWDHSPVVRRIIRFLDNVARNKEDKKQVYINSVFFEGGTTGPAPSKK